MKTKEWVRPYVKQNFGRMLLTLLLGFIGVGSGAMLLFISGYLISKASLQPANIMIIYIPIVAVRAFSIGQAVFLYLEQLASHDVALRILENMRTKLYRILEPQAMFLRSRYQTGDLLGVLSDDIEHLQALYLRTIFPSVLALFIYAVFVSVLGAFDLSFAIMMALMLGVLVFLIPAISLFITRRHHTARKKERNRLYEQLTDAVSGLSDWKASGRTEEFLKRYRSRELELLKIEQKMKRKQHVRDGFIHLMIGLTVIAMIFWTGAQAADGQIAPTVIAAFVLMTLSITDALFPVSEAIDRIPSYEESLQRMASVGNPSGKIFKIKIRENRTLTPLSDQRPSIHLKELSYRYPNSDNWQIRHLSLSISPGEKMAILGRSGAGKSTLLKLIAGALEPTEGSVYIGEQKAHIHLLAKKISILNQKPHLFNTTVGNNIRIGRPDATDEEIWKVIEQAQIDSLISSLPQGLQTPMHEMGKRFSGGERQRIAFARVLLQNTPILILDEPTIGLDPQTEQALLQTMFTAAKDKTIIWVTHHLAEIELMDQIIFLENGQIAMQGSHEQLLHSNKKYRKLYEMDQGVGSNSF